jgi:hypothetical protein
MRQTIPPAVLAAVVGCVFSACPARDQAAAPVVVAATTATASSSAPGVSVAPDSPALGHPAMLAHLEVLRPTVPEGFTLVVEPPFVVLGDEEPWRVESRSEHTVRWAVTMLKQDYFAVDPDPIIDIWLFKDDDSYRKHARELFDDDPDTPYGYYSDRHRALIMNIATGGGTLVHEIVHPYVEANFPACPAWLNEGLGSLYEACGERDGHIVGFVNWRVPGLQETIAEGSVVTLETLTHTTVEQFYGDDSGLHYAMARYLCLYMQQQGQLTRFYREFVEHQAEDPTGYEMLQRVMEIEDMVAFERVWHQWVMELQFPPP